MEGDRCGISESFVKKYAVVITQSGVRDIQMIKTYITRQFEYRELADAFIQKIKKSITALDTFPGSFQPTGFTYQNQIIYLKSKDTYLIFYIIDESKQMIYVLRVMQNRMNWKTILRRWIKQNGKVPLSVLNKPRINPRNTLSLRSVSQRIDKSQSAPPLT